VWACPRNGDSFLFLEKREGITVSWKVLRRSTLDRFEAHKDFLQLTYDALVALAQKGYATEGRGFLMIPEEDVLENLSRKPSKPGPFHLRGRLVYASFQTLQAKGYQPSADAWIHTYDPLREMLVIIAMERPEGTASYRLSMGDDAEQAVATCGFSTTLSDGQ
jgi:hypothetical protein